MSFSRAEIEAIEPGKTMIAAGLGYGTFGEPSLVLSIHAKQEDVAGKLFVCGYRQYGDGASISFSIKEGDALDGKLYRISNVAASAVARPEGGASGLGGGRAPASYIKPADSWAVPDKFLEPED